MTLTQVPAHASWPGGDGWTIAGLSATPNEMAAGFGLRFDEGTDSFDDFTLAAIDDGSGGQVWFFRYANSPEPGVEVIIDTAARRDVALSHLAAEGLPVATLTTWKAPVNTDPRNARPRRLRRGGSAAWSESHVRPEAASGTTTSPPRN